MNFLELKPLNAALLQDAVDLDKRCLGGLWTLEGYRRELDSPNSDLLVLQKMGDQNPLLGMGCLWAILDEAHITVLAIDPLYQRQGLGQLMLLALLTSAWQRGLEWATLEVRVSNQAAITLYQKFGFQEVGQRRRYYQDTGENALILWRKGLQKTEFRDVLWDWQHQIAERLNQAGWQVSVAIEALQNLTHPYTVESPLDFGSISL